ncbi:ABC transporter substrate-binding protein [Labrys wisconsinensis]|uniref:Multiple sugar transport system substrate-binding protein n=1 Tax=Labrys wisconsinensis TaxID=425677 RepID=A0ABU0JCQ0_9HYPH|nr:sugar ABC transporter substrate-binding protein [Labrys wisconsinensis]MDQ0472056.1 multiple sugar transport system substrate-binding protein [Labrys wisconsinensis]
MSLRRKVASLLAAAASTCCLALAGAAQAGELTMVEVLTSPARTELITSQLAEFEKANPDIKVNLISLPYDSSFEKLLTMYKSGQAPDVVELADRWGGLYVKGHQLEPLDRYIAKTPELASILPSVIELGKVGTKSVYRLPYGFDIRALYYSKDMLQQAGVEPPRTMDDFFKAAAIVTEKLPGKYGYCMRAGKGGGYGWGSFPMQFGATGSFFDADGNSLYAFPAFQEGMQKYADLYRKGYSPRESIAWGFGDSVAGFTSGQCALLDQDPDALPDILKKMDPSKFGVVPIPTGATGKAFPSMGYFSWAMSAASRNKDEAWKLIAFLMADKQNLALDKYLFMAPVHVGAEKDPFYAADVWKAFLTTLQQPQTYQTWTQPAYLPEWGTLYDKTMMEDGQAILLGQKDVKETAEKWAAVLTAAQKRYLADR